MIRIDRGSETSKVALAIGHTTGSQGARNADGISEWEYNKKVAYKVQEKLKDYHGVHIDIIHRETVDYGLYCKAFNILPSVVYSAVLELHFNSFSLPAKGAEVLCLRGSKGEDLAKDLSAHFRENGWVVRGQIGGVKYLNPEDRGYKFLDAVGSYLNCAAAIVEPCFGSNKEDPNYNKTFDLEAYSGFLVTFILEVFYGDRE